MLAVPMAVIMLITLVMVGVLSAGSIRSWREGQAALGQMDQLRVLLGLEVALGMERSPTNTALSMPIAVPPGRAAAIVMLRQKSDVWLREFAALPGVPDRFRTVVGALATQLKTVRATVDTVLRQPPEQRSAFEISMAIEEMAAVPSLLTPTMDEMLGEMTAANPPLATMLTATRSASDLRLFAGSIAASFNLIMARHRPITQNDVDTIRIEQGRVAEMHLRLLSDLAIANVGEQIRDEVQAMEGRYFGAAQRLIDQMTATSVSDGRFAMTQDEFVARYVPELTTLVDVRDQLFARTRQAMQADQAVRVRRLEATAAAGGAVLLAVLAALLMLHRWIIRPLAELAAMVVRLAEGDRAVHLAARRGSREVAELASAIEVLRVATIEADAAAARRRGELQRWTAQLRQVLDTLDLMHARATTITDVLPALLEQLGSLEQGDAAPPGLTRVIAATHAGIEVLRTAEGRLDTALQRMHAAGDGEDIRIDELTAAMDEVANVVTAIQQAVNGVPQMTLTAMRDLSARTGRPDPLRDRSEQAVQERILAQVQEMAAAAGGLQSALTQATHGLGELARLRA